ncbi:MAG: hypothetical protein NVV63_12495 [Opitutus sp.]|nr:hypothetical protein [Opitutus sp.]
MASLATSRSGMSACLELTDWLAAAGFIRPDDTATDIEAFARLGLDNLEQVTGSFARLQATLYAMIGRQELANAGARNVTLALEIDEVFVTFVEPLSRALNAFAPDSRLAEWTLLNLRGPSVFGPAYYADIVSQQCWMGDPDETLVKQEYPDDDSLYTKAEVIEDTAPWVMERLAITEAEESECRRLLAQFDQKLLLLLERLLHTGEALANNGSFDHAEDTGGCLDHVLFLWRPNSRIADIYDEMINMNGEAGANVYESWRIPLDEKTVSHLRLDHAHLLAAIELAQHIQATYK